MNHRATIAAVGDILMWREQVDSAKIPGTEHYSFADMFAPVASFLQGADLTIGNLETTFSGRTQPYQIGSARTGFPRFNCPDELASDLRQAGFDVLTTVNNHCLDGGPSGLLRTLDLLDQHQIAHTGTYRNQQEASSFLIREVKGIRIGILAYTYGTNKQQVPQDSPWLVNLLDQAVIEQEIFRLRPQVDLLIVCLHFGVEFRFAPTQKQRILAQSLLDRGADVILGAHPHVLQPVVTPIIATTDGRKKRTLVAYSLGNFTSEKMLTFDQSQCGAILQFTVEKDEKGETTIIGINVVPTYSQRFFSGGRPKFRVIPMRAYLRRPDKHLTLRGRRRLKQLWNRATQIIGSRFL
ncbi:capsule biosynthesis protein [Brevibacillus choshinensis]|uniref:Capsule biosynthesis protein n=1 Tax=Brevibacillus choshinensis TaxID=54911 RepID=A0ABR5NBG9_BRECH|nr:CapA family protein [Brevibacillus choshinensis]KQL48891.1 capsule biosynthesis protein [Brevibacillus choshinensis]